MFLVKSMLVTGNLKTDGTVRKTISFYNTELRRGTWALAVRSIAANSTTTISAAAVVTSNLCQSMAESKPGLIEMEESAIVQIELTRMQYFPQKKPKLIFNAQGTNEGFPINNNCGEIVFTFKNCFDDAALTLNCEVSILCYFKRLA